MRRWMLCLIAMIAIAPASLGYAQGSAPTRPPGLPPDVPADFRPPVKSPPQQIPGVRVHPPITAQVGRPPGVPTHPAHTEGLPQAGALVPGADRLPGPPAGTGAPHATGREGRMEIVTGQPIPGITPPAAPLRRSEDVAPKALDLFSEKLRSLSVTLVPELQSTWSMVCGVGSWDYAPYGNLFFGHGVQFCRSYYTNSVWHNQATYLYRSNSSGVDSWPIMPGDSCQQWTASGTNAYCPGGAEGGGDYYLNLNYFCCGWFQYRTFHSGCDGYTCLRDFYPDSGGPWYQYGSAA
jgi:hypothetical protein